MRVKLSCQEIIDYLEAYLTPKDTIGERLELFRTEPLLRVQCVANVRGYRADHMSLLAIDRIIESLFLTLNIVVPGSFSPGRAEYIDEEGNPEPPSNELFSDQLEVAEQSALESGWPEFSEVSVTETWKWLCAADVHDAGIADDPAQKAAFALFRLSSGHQHETDNILHITQILEDLLTRGEHSSATTVEKRVISLLGSIEDNERWVRDLYRLRGRIAHGAQPWLRPPGSIGDEPAATDLLREYWRVLDRGTAALIALVRDLIATDSIGYEFQEVPGRIPRNELGQEPRHVE